MGWLLAISIFVPIAGAVFIALGCRTQDSARRAALATTLLALGCVAIVVFSYNAPKSLDPAGGPIQPQMELRKTWLSFEIPTAGGQASIPAKLEFYLGMDGISIWMYLLTAMLMTSAVLVSWEAISEKPAAFYAWLLLLEAGMLGVFCAFDLVLFYVFFEFTLIPLFFLIGIWGGPKREYAARKFFIYTLSGSVLTLVGLVAMVMSLHAKEPGKLTFAIPELAQGMDRQMRIAEGSQSEIGSQPTDEKRIAAKEFWQSAQWWIFLALFAGFAIKVPLFPFHTWLPLAHVEAPTAGSVLLAGILLKLGSYGFLRLALPLLPYGCQSIGAPLIAVLAVVGILYGALCALAQEDVKRLVAYSSVSHLGFCMLGLAALNAEGVTGSVLQMVNHGLSTGLLFLVVGMLYERYHTRMMGELGGIASRLPLLSIAMIFACLSSIGLPGLNGFVGEFLTLIGAFKSRPVSAIFGTFGIVLGAWYVLAMLQRVFFGTPEHLHGDSPSIPDLLPREKWAIVPLAVWCLWIGIFPNRFIQTMKPEVEAIVRRYEKPDYYRTPVRVANRETR